MKIAIAAIGRLKAGPERELMERYTKRIEQVGKSLGFGNFSIREFSESQAQSVTQRKSQEGEQLLKAKAAGCVLVALDENGTDFSSPQFSKNLGDWRDEGIDQLLFVIGGPDGIDPDLLAKCQHTMRLGKMTWPHQIARCLLCEQIYRAFTILAGHPYHRQ